MTDSGATCYDCPGSRTEAGEAALYRCIVHRFWVRGDERQCRSPPALHPIYDEDPFHGIGPDPGYVPPGVAV